MNLSSPYIYFRSRLGVKHTHTNYGYPSPTGWCGLIHIICLAQQTHPLDTLLQPSGHLFKYRDSNPALEGLRYFWHLTETLRQQFEVDMLKPILKAIPNIVGPCLLELEG